VLVLLTALTCGLVAVEEYLDNGDNIACGHLVDLQIAFNDLFSHGQLTDLWCHAHSGVDAVCRTGETAAARADRGISGSRVVATFVLQHAGDSGKVSILLMGRRKPGCLTA
jgi:hypothetical protein